MKKRLKENDEFLLELIKISIRAKDLRIKRGYPTVESFIKAKGLSGSLYRRFENGDDITFSNLVKIIKAFDMPFAEFFRDKSNASMFDNNSF